ncbi:16S rRNA (cytosine(1402)-N(4))-methyltransferase RsmH [soil metagenome]
MNAAVDAFRHDPVMVDEIVEVFAPVPAGTVLDATLGGGGHADALLDRYEHLTVIGIDRDDTALAAAEACLARFGDRVRTAHRRFDDIDLVLQEYDIDSLSGAVFDLGVSSPQLDEAERGFSYRQDGPLEMRMDRRDDRSAADVVNRYDVDELSHMIRRYGDERFARRIARAIVAARPIESTLQLAAVVTTAIPAATRRTGGHPAKRMFQAIRIEVNGELAVLPHAIDQAVEALGPGGRIAVLTYHSGEDRIVKERLRAAEGGCNCPPGLPCVCGAVALVKRVRAPRTPSDTRTNPRARSARLRVAERIDPPRSNPL